METNNLPLPRIKGRVGIGEEDGKHYYEISMWNVENTKQFGEPFILGPFESEPIAAEEGKKAIAHVMKTVFGDHFHDMKDGGKMKSLKDGGLNGD